MTQCDEIKKIPSCYFSGTEPTSLLWSVIRSGKWVSFDARSTSLDSPTVEEFIEPEINQNGVQTRKISLLQQGLSSRFPVWRRKTTGITIPAIPALFQPYSRVIPAWNKVSFSCFKILKKSRKISLDILSCFTMLYVNFYAKKIIYAFLKIVFVRGKYSAAFYF